MDETALKSAEKEHAGGRCILATAAGAYFATSAGDDDPLRTALYRLLARPLPWGAPAVGAQGEAAQLSEPPPIDPAIAAVLLERDWATVALRDLDLELPSTGPLERLLPEVLPGLSSHGAALIADHQGLQIAAAGFDDTQSRDLAALSSEAVGLGLRHRRLIRDRGWLTPAAWAMVDAAGNSQLGVWPLFIGSARFALVVSGRPIFAKPPFVRLIRTLARRVAAAASFPPGSQ